MEQCSQPPKSPTQSNEQWPGIPRRPLGIRGQTILGSVPAVAIRIEARARLIPTTMNELRSLATDPQQPRQDLIPQQYLALHNRSTALAQPFPTEIALRNIVHIVFVIPAGTSFQRPQYSSFVFSSAINSKPRSVALTTFVSVGSIVTSGHSIPFTSRALGPFVSAGILPGHTQIFV